MTDVTSDLSANPLLSNWQRPFGLPPFDLIRPEHFMPAFAEGMKIEKEEIAAITSNQDAPTFENTIIALETSGALLSRVNRVFDCVSEANTNDLLDAIDIDITPVLTKHYGDIKQDSVLFDRIKAVYQTRETLPPQAQRLVEKTYFSFVKSGALLTAVEKERVSDIQVAISSLAAKFGQNVSAEEKAYMLFLNTDEDRAGLSDAFLQSAAAAADERGLPGEQVVTLAMSSREAFMTQSANRKLRRDLFHATKARGQQGGVTDNCGIIEEIAGLRQQLAGLMGFESFADFQLYDKMAETPAAVDKLHRDLWNPARAAMLNDRVRIEEIAHADGLNGDLEPWDWMYYAEKVRQQQYAIDEQDVCKYLTLDRGIEAAFYAANQLFGLQFEERRDLPTYHPDVRAWEVKNANGDHVAVFYGDYFARPSKRGGAWASKLREQNGITGETPIIFNVCNFSKPADGQPAMLGLEDYAGTLFHEFGHALHSILSKTDYPSLAGTNVLRDFVELPSQLYEKWAMSDELLERFALHHETGEPMPHEMRRKIRAAQTFNQGYGMAEYLGASVLDMIWHTQRAGEKKTVAEVDAEMVAMLDLPPQATARHQSPHFGHIVRGYAAGYYSYRWADVLVADAFNAFRETGNVFDPATARRLHDSIYAAGDTKKPQQLYRDFRGHDADIGPLLAELGFTAQATKPTGGHEASLAKPRVN